MRLPDADSGAQRISRPCPSGAQQSATQSWRSRPKSARALTRRRRIGIDHPQCDQVLITERKETHPIAAISSEQVASSVGISTRFFRLRIFAVFTHEAHTDHHQSRGLIGRDQAAPFPTNRNTSAVSQPAPEAAVGVVCATPSTCVLAFSSAAMRLLVIGLPASFEWGNLLGFRGACYHSRSGIWGHELILY